MDDWPNKQGGLSEGDVVGLGYHESTAMRGGVENLKRPGARKAMTMIF
jgi:hypothetical protein